MTLSDKVEQQFKSLLAEIQQVKNRCGWDEGKGRWSHWPTNDEHFRIRTQGLNLIKIACGEGSEHFRELRRLAETKETADRTYYLIQVNGIIQAAFQDFQAGLLFETENRIRAYVLDDFLEQADFLLSEGCHIAAVSLGGAVLEDTLRKMCDRRGVPYPDKTTIDALNASLAKQNVYDKLVQKQITAHADLRNKADHGHFTKVQKEDVSDFLKWLRRFVLEHLT